MKFNTAITPISAIIILICSVSLSFGQDFPEPMNPPRLVNDFVGLLTDNEFKNLEYKLEQYEDTTSNQIAIVIIRSTGSYDIAQYSAELGEKWGVGKQGRDNGLLILAAMDDRDVYISTGYGLEGAVPDAAAYRIIQDYIIPNFRNQNYYTGFDEATSIVMGLAAGEFTADQLSGGRANRKSRRSLWSLLIPILFFGLISFSRYRRMARNHHGHDVGFWAILALMMSSSGHRGGSNWDNFRGGSGTFGGGGGGGFGGFGGGGFGGGGAGGSW